MALNNLTRVTGSGFGTETSINTAGIITAASFSGDGSSLTGVVGSGSGVVIREEGSNVGTAQTINFVGTGVTATISGAVATIEITSSGGGGGSGISNVVEDTTPQLGGNLDVNGKDITGTGNVNLTGVSTFGSTNLSSLSVGTALDITSTNSSSTIQANNSSSPFYIQGLNNNLISILAGTGSQGRVTLYNQGKVEIAHAGSVKFETTSTGAEITGNLTATSFSGDVTGTASTATNVTVADESSDTSCFLLYSTEATGNIAPKTGSNLTFNSSSGTLSAATFVGDGSGLTGITASGSGVIVRDGGSLVGTAGTIDFGTNVSVSPISAGVVTVTAAAGTIAGINTSGTTELNNLIVSGIATFPNNIDANGNLNLAGEFQLSGGIAAGGSSDNLNWGSGNFYFNSGNPELGWISGDAKLVVRAGSSTYGNTFSIQGRNARDNMAVFTTGGGADLYYNDVKKFETTGIGITVTGTTFSNQLSVSGVSTFHNNISIPGNRDIIMGGATDDTSGALKIYNNSNRFFEIFSTSKEAYIRNTGSNANGININANGSVVLGGGGSGGFSVQAETDGTAKLYGPGPLLKLQTTNSGVIITGVATATTFSGSGANLTNLPAANITGTLPAISGANLTNLPSPTPADTDVQVTYDVSSNGSSGYRFTGPGYSGADDNPDIYLVRGQRYRFINGTGSGHPFRIQSDTSGTAYTDGVSGSQSGTQDFNVQHDAPVRLYYQCTIHAGMIGNIYVVGASDWRMTDVATNATPEIFTSLNVGIGTASPDYLTTIAGGSGNSKLNLKRLNAAANGNAFGSLFYTNSDGTDVASVRAHRESAADDAYLGFGTRNAGGSLTEKLRITSAGQLNLAGNMQFTAATPEIELNNGGPRFRVPSANTLTIHTGGGLGATSNEKLRIQSGGGISFNGDTADANALDDYEEGTWTPVYRGAGTAGTYTYGDQLGVYTKIGRSVHVTIRLTNITEAAAASGSIRISGLPFAADASMTGGNMRLDQFDLGANARNLAFIVGSSTDYLSIYQTNDGSGDTAINESARQSNTADIIGSFTYNTTS